MTSPAEAAAEQSSRRPVLLRWGMHAFCAGWAVFSAAQATRGGWWLAAGACGVPSAAAVWWSQLGPWRGGAPTAGTEGTVLPRRPANLTAGVAACFLFPLSSSLLAVAELASDDPSRLAGLMLLFAPIVFAGGVWLAVAGALGRGRMELTPAGFTYRPLLGRRTVTTAWSAVADVVSDGGYGNGVFVVTHQGRVPLWTGGQGLRPATLLALLQWYARHAGDRAETRDAGAVGRRIGALDDPAARVAPPTG